MLKSKIPKKSDDLIMISVRIPKSLKKRVMTKMKKDNVKSMQSLITAYLEDFLEL